MDKSTWIPIVGLTLVLVAGPWAPAPSATAQRASGQSAPYIGFVYPAGGQQGTTVEVRLGGQRIDGAHAALVSGDGVSAEVSQFYRKLSNQEVTLLREQLRELRGEVAQQKKAKQAVDEATEQFIVRLEKRIGEWVNRPACEAVSSIALVKVTIDRDAEPGAREIRLIGARGMTNPMVFHVGQLPESSRKPMLTSPFQVLGKEALAQRKRPAEEIESRIELPCTVNGQIASGEVNRYRFEARAGQRLVISTKARELVPFIADAVPGWFQPVMALYDSEGRELAFNDDYRFKPDPTLFLDVPRDGEYVLTITDALYRGREDFVYRISIGQLPFVTSVFPLGSRAGQAPDVELFGRNLEQAQLSLPSPDAAPGIYQAVADVDGLASNTFPLAVDALPEGLDREPNNRPADAQPVKLPIIINGRIDRPDDWDVFKITANAGDRIVAEVHARRLDSPLDSMLKVTDSSGKPLAHNDDHIDPAAGLNTHHADSYVAITLPEDGDYFVHLGDTTRDGGPEHGYRLRLSRPRPDFALRVVPSSLNLRGKSAAAVTVYAIRRDGFEGPINLNVEDLPDGFTAAPVTLKAHQNEAKLFVRSHRNNMDQPVDLTIVGRAKMLHRTVTHPAVPAEDRMQAFLWRHLVPAQDLKALVINAAAGRPPTRVRPPKLEPKDLPTGPPQFSKNQVAGRLRQLNLLFDEWLLTDDFYRRKVAQCEVYGSAEPVVAKKK
ncbi:PPC domain-containing protein [Stieleria sp.]|uniref:PPC domain-containing protein n=1 Tax=Stieleria sp. TaxID=2795976 RepID=UPI003563F8DB